MYEQIDEGREYRVYGYRHVVSLLYVFAMVSTSLLMNTTVPIANVVA
jgi:hypothetical protein